MKKVLLAAAIAMTSLLSTAMAADMININKADVSALDKINGIGQKKAEAIVAYRTSHGDFKTLEDIKEVPGIGDKLFAKIKPSLSLNDDAAATTADSASAAKTTDTATTSDKPAEEKASTDTSKATDKAASSDKATTEPAKVEKSTDKSASTEKAAAPTTTASVKPITFDEAKKLAAEKAIAPKETAKSEVKTNKTAKAEEATNKPTEATKTDVKTDKAAKTETKPVKAEKVSEKTNAKSDKG